jgi:Lrp/AsnC family transcriptional regulator for asnA, asnC and gidA
LQRINEIPFVTASVTTGKFNIFCKIRAKDTKHAKDVIFMIDDIDGVYRTETMISEESINERAHVLYLKHVIYLNAIFIYNLKLVLEVIFL